MKIRYCGSALDYSGYGEANRHDIAALVNAGVNVTTQLPRFTHELADYGELGELARSLENKDIGYKIKILHITPNIYPQYFEEGIYHIGRVFWETDQLPLDFAQNVQLLDEIWTGSEHNRQCIIKSGVTKPVYIIPEAIDTSIDPLSFKPYLTAADRDGFKFYSIFEWTERKNPKALLKAYWQEFGADDKVSLTIKTYVDNFRPEKKQLIKKQIMQVKHELGLSSYAPVYIYSNLLNRSQMYRFHRSFDCFVSAHRGEGWGIPQMEAMLMNKPVISTNCGGVHEYIGKAKDVQLIDYSLVRVQTDRNPNWYTMQQKWAEIDIAGLQEAMRKAYNHGSKKYTGVIGADIVKEKFSFKAVGQQMAKRLKEIQKDLEPVV
ncbi:MAG: hypothetical protein MOGMAGMI_01803 [Candidatus Omnitrophica bacterium]|nr:hypothetical protein [Candidatus Omnitrophota bacterium]